MELGLTVDLELGLASDRPPKSADMQISPSSTMDALTLAPPHAALPPAFLPSAAPVRCLVAGGGHHALAVRGDGSVVASGGSSLVDEGDVFIAHLGLGAEYEWGALVEEPQVVAVPEGEVVVEVATGSLHSLLLCASGALLSCGGGWEGALGHGDEATLAVPKAISALPRIESIAAGGAHSLAIAEGGVLWSWGWGRYGQLGLGDERSQRVPCRISVNDEVRFVQAAAGAAHSLALSVDGAVYSFGRSHAGQCGHGDASGELAPRLIEALRAVRVRRIGASGDGSSATAMAGKVERYEWGDAADGKAVLAPALAR